MKTGVPLQVASEEVPFTSGSIPDHVERITNVGVESSNCHPGLVEQEESVELRRSKRPRIAKDLGSDFITYQIEGDPSSFRDAMASPEAKYWKDAIKSEIDSILSNGTWELVDLPPGSTTIGCE